METIFEGDKIPLNTLHKILFNENIHKNSLYFDK